MDRFNLAKNIFNASYITGEFQLRSGAVSHEYFDKYRFESDPALLSAISEKLEPMVDKSADGLAALEMGGIPVGTAISLASGLPCLYVRKEAKSYGTCQLAEGFPVAGKKLVVVEDVVTTGGQIVKSVNDLRGLGAEIDSVLCVIYRGEDSGPALLAEHGLTLHYLFTMAEIKSIVQN